jgi:hypothetical protein
MIKYLSFFDKVWTLTGRFQDKNLLKQAVKDISFHMVIKPIAKLFARRNPDNGAGVFIPIKPGLDDVADVLLYADKICPVFIEHLEEDFVNLPNDTG